MRRVLIIGWSHSLLKAFSERPALGYDFDYLILKKDQAYDFGTFEEQYVYVDEQMLPIQSFLQDQSAVQTLTVAQKQTRQKINSVMARVLNSLNYSSQKKLFQKNARLESANLDFTSDQFSHARPKIYFFEQINDIKIDNQKKKVFLELKNNPVVEYDHVLIEKSDLVFAELENKKLYKKSFFASHPDENMVWSAMTYKVDIDLKQAFWLVDDANYDSVYDNVFYVRPYLKEGSYFIDVWSWLFYYHKDNPEMLLFWKKRIQEKITKHFSFMQTQEQKTTVVYHPLTAAHSVKLKTESLMTFFTPLSFKGQEQVQIEINKITQTLTQKMKKNKNTTMKSTTSEAQP